MQLQKVSLQVEGQSRQRESGQEILACALEMWGLKEHEVMKLETDLFDVCLEGKAIILSN